MSNAMRQKMADTIRFLAADMVQQANSGHPGAPMGLADIAVVLSEHMNHNPRNPQWLNRDRLVFSGGHGTGLIYSLNYLWGYGLEIEDLKQFRQLHSKTPGHPEYGHTAGIEITTGPLGQGIANAVGFSMASAYVGNKVNSETAQLIDHKVYCLCGDGDLEEGISLAKNADQIRLCDILEAIGEPLEHERCILGFEKCDASNPCALHEQWVQPKELIETMLTTTTLASLLDNKETKL